MQNSFPWLEEDALFIASSSNFHAWLLYMHTCTYVCRHPHKLLQQQPPSLRELHTHTELKAYLYPYSAHRHAGLNLAAFLCVSKGVCRCARLSCVPLGCRGESQRSSSSQLSYCSDPPADTLSSWNASFNCFPTKKVHSPPKKKRIVVSIARGCKIV